MLNVYNKYRESLLHNFSINKRFVTGTEVALDIYTCTGCMFFTHDWNFIFKNYLKKIKNRRVPPGSRKLWLHDNYVHEIMMIVAAFTQQFICLVLGKSVV